MKEKVAARTAAHDSMKKRWVLSASETEGKHGVCECDVFKNVLMKGKTGISNNISGHVIFLSDLVTSKLSLVTCKL